jgi:hypothetical protein
MRSIKISRVIVLTVILLVPQICRAAPLMSGFTYQGHLYDANYAANGFYDFQFKLYDDTTTGKQLGNTIDISDISVVDGYFTVELDFGSNVFDGNECYLQIEVRAGVFNYPCEYTILLPRQKVTPTPYSLQTRGVFTDNAGNVGIGTVYPGNYKLNVDGNMYAANYYGNGSNLTGIPVGDNTISKSKLKTATGEVSVTGSNNYCILPGGEYGFYPQFKSTNDSDCVGAIMLGGFTSEIKSSFLPQVFGNMSTYRTTICLSNRSGTVLYAKQRYITSSGTDYWIFLLIDKQTHEIVSGYAAPDHPAYGNGGDFEKKPHPFDNYDESKQEIVLLEKENTIQLKQESEQHAMSILTLINEQYKLNMDVKEVYQPLHSGKFLTENGEQVKQMVQIIPSYITVRKVEKLTNQDIRKRAALIQQRIQKTKQDAQKKEKDKQNAINKLKALGLNEAEISVLTEK